MFEKLSIFSRFSSDKKKKIQQVNITEISIKLKDQQTKLDESLHRLKERDKDLFSKVVRAQIEGDSARATIYAQEIADIRKMMKIIYTAFLAIEKVRLKLDTVKELQGVSLVLFPVAKILGEMKEQIKGIAPDVALSFDSIASSVNSIAIETGAINDKSIVPAVIDEQAKKILEEAQRTAEAKIKEMLPDLPHPPSNVTYSQQVKPQVQPKALSEKELLDYISSTGGFLDIDYITGKYGVNKDEVMSLLKEMANKGLISLEE
ncbi:cell division protein [Acidianus sulfidivorans JP7]|uniref:Cell division protein n=1 Tax=Acidianus sulfidivorans JP7 TaxID=619593 RepID=A0A2U9IP34_9CREN|nr:cell division protein CdvB [Acidianus sulfidivorans]AWR97746.1 cell division protein [Acidianus sulfidivorans JP7]